MWRKSFPRPTVLFRFLSDLWKLARKTNSLTGVYGPCRDECRNDIWEEMDNIAELVEGQW